MRWEFADCLEAEDAGGLIYLWPRQGAPAIAPTRVFRDADETAVVNSCAISRRACRAALPGLRRRSH